ncbi:Rrf2 family transcriptional regulator [Candidatus Gottesmanbacteria bacterium]|nr:Rrf2 family transcriptional regulator [Candidatus Gottesmanbacteria bacterium]
MHFQKHEHYALLLMGELARRNGVEPLSLTSVSRDHGISLPFLKKIVRSLRLAGLVQSKEGFGGGYIVARQPESISIWEILSSFEVMHDKKPESVVCPLNASCLPQHIRSIVSQTIQDRLERISLKEAI